MGDGRTVTGSVDVAAVARYRIVPERSTRHRSTPAPACTRSTRPPTGWRGIVDLDVEPGR